MSAAGGSPGRLHGRVSADGDALVDLDLIGPSGQIRLTCVVDTGFNRELIVPPAIVAQLRLPRVVSRPATLADGSRLQLDGYAAEVDWLSGRRPVLVYVTSADETLLGTGLLAANRLTIDFPARTVEIA